MDRITNKDILTSFAELVDGTLLVTKELPDQFSSPMILGLTGHGKLRPDQIPDDYIQFAEIKGRLDGRDMSLMCLLINHDLCQIYLRVYFRSIKDFQMQTKSYLVGFKERPKIIEGAMRMVMPERYKMSDKMTADAELIQIPGINYVRTNMPQECKRLLSNDNITASIADTSEIIMMTVGQFVSGKGCVELALAQKGSSLERLQMHLALLETILQSLVQQGIIY